MALFPGAIFLQTTTISTKSGKSHVLEIRPKEERKMDTDRGLHHRPGVHRKQKEVDQISELQASREPAAEYEESG